MEVKVLVTQWCPTLRSHGPDTVIPWTVAPRLLCPWNSLVRNIGVGCHFLLQGIFLI